MDNHYEFGHWQQAFPFDDSYKQFVYIVTLNIDHDVKYYIGYKKINKGWTSYKTSQKIVKSNIDKVISYKILKFFDTVEAGLEYEDELLIKFDCVNSNKYLNMCRKGVEFNVLGRKLQTDEIERIKVNNSRKCIHDEKIIYNQVKEAANTLNIQYSTLLNRCKYQYCGWRYLDDKIMDKKSSGIENTKKCVGPDNVIYDQVKTASEITGIEYSILKQRCRSQNCGWRYLAGNGSSKIIEYQNNKFNQKKELCEFLSQDLTTLNKKIQTGEITITYISNFIEKPPRKNSKGCISPQGTFYKQLSVAQTETSININTLKKWCAKQSNGWKYRR